MIKFEFLEIKKKSWSYGRRVRERTKRVIKRGTLAMGCMSSKDTNEDSDGGSFQKRYDTCKRHY